MVTFESDLNYYRIDREVYNMLDWLGDLGGLKEAMMLILAFIFATVKYGAFENFLVEKLYRSQTRKDRFSVSAQNTKPDDIYFSMHEGKKLKRSKVNCITQRFHDSGLCLRYRDKQEKLFAAGRE